MGGGRGVRKSFDSPLEYEYDRKERERAQGPQERSLLPPEDAEAGAEADVPTGLPFPQLRLRRG